MNRRPQGMLTAAALTGLMAASGAGSQPGIMTPQPIEREGSCPDGYVANGAYCVPMNEGSPFVVRREGACPAGYHAFADYCVAGQGAEFVIPRQGRTCPPNWTPSGDYCREM